MPAQLNFNLALPKSPPATAVDSSNRRWGKFQASAPAAYSGFAHGPACHCSHTHAHTKEQFPACGQASSQNSAAEHARNAGKRSAGRHRHAGVLTDNMISLQCRRL